MKELLRIFVRGLPKAQPRPRARAVRMHGKWIATVYQPEDDCAEWKRKIMVAVRSAPRFVTAVGPVSLTLDVWFSRPERLMKKSSPINAVPHVSKPDVDNLAKAVMDSLTTCEVWGDDSQVYKLSIWKHYVKQGDAPGVMIVVEVEDDATLPAVTLYDNAACTNGVEIPVHPGTLAPGWEART